MTESGYKYSWIPKEYYPAVMFAAKLVRQSGWFNKACRTAANYYGVDEDKVREYLSKRSHEGQAAKPKPAKKRAYFVIEESTYTCEGSEHYTRYFTTMGYSESAVNRRLTDSDIKFSIRNETGSYYSKDRFSSIVGEFATQAEAEKEAARLQNIADAEAARLYGMPAQSPTRGDNKIELDFSGLFSGFRAKEN